MRKLSDDDSKFCLPLCVRHTTDVSSSLDYSDNCLVSEEHNCSVGDNSCKVCPHPPIKSSHPFLCPHHSQSLEEIVVLSLRSGNVLSQSSSAHLCVVQGERGENEKRRRREREREEERVRKGEGKGMRGMAEQVDVRSTG